SMILGALGAARAQAAPKATPASCGTGGTYTGPGNRPLVAQLSPTPPAMHTCSSPVSDRAWPTSHCTVVSTVVCAAAATRTASSSWGKVAGGWEGSVAPEKRVTWLDHRARVAA